MLEIIRKTFMVIWKIVRTVAQWFWILFGGSRFTGPAPDVETSTASAPQIATASDAEKAVLSALETAKDELELRSSELPHYVAYSSLFTFQEGKFYRVLRDVAGDDYAIFAKVRMADFVKLANNSEAMKYHNNQILCKHVDFLLCDLESNAPQLVIELDDITHQRPDRYANDEFKDTTFKAIELPILRVTVEAHYSSIKLLEDIQTAIAAKVDG